MIERSATSSAPRLPALWRQLLVLAACALLPQLGSFGYGFVDYDDSVGIVQLQQIRTLSFAQLPRFFALEVYPWLPEYMPLKNLSYALDYACFGLWAPGYRLQQQLWYTLSVWGLFLWLRALLSAMQRAGGLKLTDNQAELVALLTAALFALHPVHVESVTWISGRKDVLSGAFGFMALFAGQAWGQGERAWRWFWACLATSALALLSKPTWLVLPLLLLVADVLSIAAPRSLRERAPLYAAVGSLCMAFAFAYFRLVRDYTSLDVQLEASVFQGPGILRWGQQLCLYFALCFMPGGLAPRIPSQLLDAAFPSLSAIWGLIVLSFSLGGLGFALVRRHALALALALFLIPLAPPLISAPWGQYLAGRYLFVSVAGPLFLLAWAGVWLVRERPHFRGPAWAAFGLLSLSLLVSALDYARSFEDSVALWSRGIDAYPQETENYERAGKAAVHAQRLPLAATIYAACLNVDADQPVCNTGLGALLVATEPARAEQLMRRALPRDQNGSAHTALALYLARRGDPGAGLSVLEGYLQAHARALTPDQLNAYAHWAVLAAQPAKAWKAALEAARLHAARFPAAPPAGDTLLEVARARGDPRFTEQVQSVLSSCQRMDCVAQALATR